MNFRTDNDLVIPAVTARQMREVDRIAVEAFHLDILQMMENAGRSLAHHVMDMLGTTRGSVTILAGAGGNGGGGLCCARHLHNRRFHVHIVLDRNGESLTGPARNQLDTLRAAGIHPLDNASVESALRQSELVVDALIGYGLRGHPHGRTAELIDLCNRYAKQVLSNDVPSGINATTGETPGAVVRANRVLTLAAPKTGLERLDSELFLTDIGIPPEVFHRIGLKFFSPFDNNYWIRLRRKNSYPTLS
jgi:NAD(P)H-hydrate epimerase